MHQKYPDDPPAVFIEINGRRTADERGLSEKVFSAGREWANRADLMRVEGITGRHADTLENIGVDTVVELGTRNSEHLYEKIKEYGETQRAAISVTQKQIETWTQLARK